MVQFLVAAGSAAWLGILTSVSPCPLATNIAAISFIGRNVNGKLAALLSGLAYTLGRTATYTLLGLVLVSSSSAAPHVSMFLQQKMTLLLGPFLIFVGLILLDLVKVAFPGMTLSLNAQEKLARGGLLGAFVLGVVFALSFCPVSAALFFGSTFGLAVAHNSRFVIPALYGVGTAAPVVGFAFVVAFSAQAVGSLFHKISVVEIWARRISGIVFILAGLYMVLSANLHLL
jgi:cytochrome c-type biogenesis protein